MYRSKLEELRKEKNLSIKKWAELSGVSVDTITRVLHPESPTKDAPRISTLEELCRALEVELWEIFYAGDKSLVSLSAEVTTLRAERDALIVENAVKQNTIDTMRDKIDALKDEIIDVHRHYIKKSATTDGK